MKSLTSNSNFFPALNRDKTLFPQRRGEKIFKKITKKKGISPLYSSRKAIDHLSLKIKDNKKENIMDFFIKKSEGVHKL